MNGQFVISLDYELFWGTCQKRQLDVEKPYLDNMATVIPGMLHLFEQNEIHATWATVGMLFLNDWDDWDNCNPKQLPQYENPEVSTYVYARGLKRTREEEKYFFAPEVVQRIANTAHQEIGSHTYSHYFCTEPGQTVDTFVADLQAADKAAARYGIKLRSLVFPRNQYNKDYLAACYQHGYNSVRSNPPVWYWQENEKETLSKKIFRTGDAYVPLGKKNMFSCNSMSTSPSHPLSIPANRLLRRYNEKYPVLNKLRLSNIVREMEHAAKWGMGYHLWWHPEDFRRSPHENMEDLKIIIEKYTKLKDRYGFASTSMSGLAGNISLHKEVVL